jgi:hypothetical protein
MDGSWGGEARPLPFVLNSTAVGGLSGVYKCYSATTCMGVRDYEANQSTGCANDFLTARSACRLRTRDGVTNDVWRVVVADDGKSA